MGLLVRLPAHLPTCVCISPFFRRTLTEPYGRIKVASGLTTTTNTKSTNTNTNKKVTGGGHHSMALSGPNGLLYAFGRSDSSQLGVGKGDALKPGACSDR